MKKRCFWAEGDPLEIPYHDNEWGVAVHDDTRLFEMLILEGAQAGLSWSTILRKRDAYRKAYRNFDPQNVARFTDRDVARLMNDAGIVRNAAKIDWSIKNAKAFREVQREHGSFASYLWSYVDGTELSDRISKDLRKLGFGFVGSTIIYAFLQAVGVVDDHELSCFRAKKREAAHALRR